MVAEACTEQEFIALWKRLGTGAAVSRELGVTLRNVMSRRRNIEKKHGIRLGGDSCSVTSGARAVVTLENATVMIGSDAHYWPDHITTAHKGFVKLCKELKPKIVVMNGDMVDLPTISRFPRIGWEHRPQVKKELEAVQDRLDEIVKANRGAKFFWPLGNHDARFETRLAQIAPEYEGVAGMTLKDHFPRWTPCWSVMINEICIVKHRWHTGIHAVYNNALRGGITVATGHLHSLKVTPWTDYTGDRYGVDCGTLAEPFGPQFEGYLEDSARNWRSGFAVLTFQDGKLMPPELAQVMGEKLWFRGGLMAV